MDQLLYLQLINKIFMKKLEQHTIKAFVNLGRDHNFEIVLKWFQESLDEINLAMADLEPDIRLRWEQGKAQNLGEIIKKITEADKALNDLQQRQEKLPRQI